MAKEKKQPIGDYEVGYGKPPKATQFQKGKSGNPNGRPKGSKNNGSLLEKILNEPVEVRENGRTRRMSQREVMLRKQAQKAMTGDSKAFDQVMKRVEKQEEKAAAPNGAVSAPVLVVPGIMNVEEWARMAKAHQAKYAGNTGEDPEDGD